VFGFRIVDNHDDPQGTFPTVPYAKNTAFWYSAKAMDPRTGDVWLSAGDSTDGKQLMHWSAASNTWTKFQTSPIYPSHRRLESWQRVPLIFDPVRNRIVTIMKSKYTDACGPNCSFIMQTVNVTTGVVTNLPVTGPLPVTNGQGRGFVYDADNDRYVYFDFRGYPATSCTIYAVNPVTAATSLIGSCRIPRASIEGRVGYFPTLGGIAYIAQSTSPVQFLPTR
jgi:hypothetical protein